MLESNKKRLHRYSSVTEKDRSVQLCVAAAIGQKRKMSPLSKLRETRGLVTVKRPPSNFDLRNAQAKKERESMPYKMPQPFIFRDTNKNTVLKLGQKDFGLIGKPEPLENPGHISVHNTLPKFWADKESQQRMKQETEEGLAGKETWHQYH